MGRHAYANAKARHSRWYLCTCNVTSGKQLIFFRQTNRENTAQPKLLLTHCGSRNVAFRAGNDSSHIVSNNLFPYIQKHTTTFATASNGLTHSIKWFSAHCVKPFHDMYRKMCIIITETFLLPWTAVTTSSCDRGCEIVPRLPRETCTQKCRGVMDVR